MKQSQLVSILISLIFTANTAQSSIVDTDQDIICNSQDHSDCYPKLFSPTDEWQVIKEGQEIPPGLHVRLNIDTLAKEAKLIDPNEQSQQGQSQEEPQQVLHAPQNGDIVLSDQQPDQNQQDHENSELQRDEIIRKKVEEFKQKQQQQHHQGKPAPRKSKVSVEDVTDFGSSVDQLYQFEYDHDLNLLDKSLENLVELSHDIEFGIRLTEDKLTFDTLMSIVHGLPQNFDVQEKIYRIMGSTLRNNPEAVTNVLKDQSESFIHDLLSQLNSSVGSPDVIKKRILGVVQALCADDHFSFKYFNKNDPSVGIVKLIEVFPSVESSTRSRIINIFEDLGLIAEVSRGSSDKRSIEESVSADHKLSTYLQDQLANSKAQSEQQFKSLFNTLVNLHQENNSLKPNQSFLEWLSQETTLRRNGVKERDHTYSNTDSEFDEYMLKVRHEVFGNKNAYRKVADEL